MKMKLKESTGKNIMAWKDGSLSSGSEDEQHRPSAELVASMSKRQAEVIEKDGWTTHY
jgi:hypothetical protein